MQLTQMFTALFKKQKRKDRVNSYLRDQLVQKAPEKQPFADVASTTLQPLTKRLQLLGQSVQWRDLRQDTLREVQVERLPDTAEIPQAISQDEVAINRNLVASVAGVSLAATGIFFYLPLAWLSVPFTVYASIDVLRDASDALVEERKLRHSILDATVIVSALLSQYYLASAMAGLIYYTGYKLMAMTEDNAQQTLRKIMGEQPQVVWRLVDGIEVETPLTALQVGDVIVGNTGDTLPIDGYVINGFASIDQRLLSGEARPVEKEPGAPVYAGTTLLAGRIHICVEKAGSDTVAAQIGDILLRTADYKSTLLTRGEEISDRSVLPTLGLSAVTLAMLGPASAVAVIGANYAELLRIVAPLSMLNFLAMASQQGILIKDGRALELLNDVDTVVFDKT
ncbi:MAG: hypothetical protein KDE47_15755, partial [Caldilineaceae bacterium]|nr:hypothetical protein [Caldilineaceae bacterium]